MALFVSNGTDIPVAPIKDPNSEVDYGCDWSNWLTGNEVISTSTWTVSSGLTLGVSANTTNSTSIFVSGGVVKRKYTLANKIVTDAGRTEERSMIIECKQK